MEYRRLGRTELQVSLLGVGGGYISILDVEAGRDIYQRAFELGINYFDGRYGATSTMLNPLIKDRREQCVVVTKTAEHTRDGALRRVDEDLAELDTPYLDVFYLRVYNDAMMAAHLAPGGALEGLLQAREEGKIRHLGLAGHSDMGSLADGIETDMFDAVIFPLNVVRRDAYERLIPVAQKHDVGLVIMKPINAYNVLPAQVALPWLATQPIHTMVPGVSTIEHLEQNAAALDRKSWELTPAEQVEVERWREKLDHETCRICADSEGVHPCQAVCEANLPIDMMLYHDVFYNEYNALGLEQLLQTALANPVKARYAAHFERRLELVRACTHCGRCEEICPHQLPIRARIDRMLEDHVQLIEAVRAAGWDELGDDEPFYLGRPDPKRKG